MNLFKIQNFNAKIIIELGCAGTASLLLFFSLTGYGCYSGNVSNTDQTQKEREIDRQDALLESSTKNNRKPGKRSAGNSNGSQGQGESENTTTGTTTTGTTTTGTTTTGTTTTGTTTTGTTTTGTTTTGTTTTGTTTTGTTNRSSTTIVRNNSIKTRWSCNTTRSSGVAACGYPLGVSKKVDSVWHAPLHLETNYGTNLSLVQCLVDNGADVNVRSMYCRVPLHRTKNYESESAFKIFEYLITNGADVMAKDTSGMTPLHYAARSGKFRNNNFKIPQLLLDHGADINDVHSVYGTPLHAASMFGTLQIIKWLIEEKGAKVNIRNVKDKTPLTLAKEMGRSAEIINFLESKDATE